MWERVGFTDFSWAEVARVVIRLVLALVLGGAIGLEREVRRKPAGMRTFMLIAMSGCAFTLLGLELAEKMRADLTHVIQGVAMGVGFLGAGTVLTLPDRAEVRGLTTASAIWVASAIGVATGAGWFTIAITLSVLTLLVLTVLGRLERREQQPEKEPKELRP